MSYLFINFKTDGNFESFSQKERVCDFKTDEYSEEFKENPQNYRSVMENGEIVGVELRDDLEEYKKQQELINQEINIGL